MQQVRPSRRNRSVESMTSITQDEARADVFGDLPNSMYIGGAWTAAACGASMESIDPSTGKVWTQVPAGDVADVDRAVAAATAAMEGEWGATQGPARARLLNKLADLVDRDADRLAAVESRDNGKLIRETRPAVGQVAAWLRYFAGAADKIAGHTLPTGDPNYLVYTTREPVGVVGAIIPFNAPLMITAMKVAPALAAGCAVVIKTADQTPTSTLLLAELVEEAGFPAGAFNVLTGPGVVVGDALARHDGVAQVSFTGSTAVGTSVMKAAAEHVAPVTLELGGKSPNIVFADADLDAAVNGVIGGIFASTGQMCIAGGRLLVQETVHDELVDRLRARAETILLGDPQDPASEMGPLVSEAQLNKVLDLVASGVDEGATLVTGGTRAAPHRVPDGYFVEPTSSPASNRTCDWRVKRSSARCLPSSRSVTRSTPSNSAMTRSSGSPVVCGPRTSSVPIGWRAASAAASYGSTATATTPRTFPSAGCNRAASDEKTAPTPYSTTPRSSRCGWNCRAQPATRSPFPAADPQRKDRTQCST